MLRLSLLASLSVILSMSAAGQPTAEEVFPFQEGNRWVYDNYYTQSSPSGSTTSGRGVTEWIVSGTLDTPSGTLPRLEIRRDGGEPTVCAVHVRSSDTEVAFDLLTEDGSTFCEAGAYIAPSPMHGPNTGFGLRSDDFSEQEVRIGGIDYTVMDGQGGWPGDLDEAYLFAAVGIGVRVFVDRDYFLGLNVLSYSSVLRYAVVDGAEYGSLVVTDESGPDVSGLSLAIGPNPARASARLFIGGDAAVRVTVLDALGRVVETREATPGTLTLDTSRWAVGVYVIRAENADGVVKARLTVVR